MSEALAAESSLEAALRPGRHGHAIGEAGVRVAERVIEGAVSLAARDAGNAAVSEALGWDLPWHPGTLAVEGCQVVWTGPGRWLVFSDRHIEPMLRERAGAAASVADQSDSRVVLRLDGSRVRDVLAKGVAIDLHRSAFAVGISAATLAAHIPVLLWREDDDGFALAIPRSFLGSFVEWLTESAAEYGLEVG